MARMLAKPTLALPQPDESTGNKATDDQTAVAKAINEFSTEAFESNTTNLSRSVEYLKQSYDWLRKAYAAMVTVGLFALVVAVIKAAGADSGAENAGAGVIAGVSAAALLGALFLKPSDSMERTAVLVPWVLLVLNTYWTRLAYMDDREKIDGQLEDAAKDAAEQFKAIAEAMASAQKVEGDRLVALAVPAPAGESEEEKKKKEEDEKKEKEDPNAGEDSED